MKNENTQDTEFCGIPKINIRCEIRVSGIIVTTTLNVIRIEKEDDGSYTAVTDYWPTN